jgi:transposase
MEVSVQQTVSMQEYLQVLARVEDLEAQLAWFQRQFFGRKSERFVPDIPGQLLLDFGGTGVDVAAVEAVKQTIEAHERSVPSKKSAHQGREALPADLPRVKEVIEPQEDTTGMVRIGEDITEVVEYEAGRVWVRQTIRPRYARTEEQQAAAEAAAEAEGQTPPPTVIQAPAPDGPFPRLKAGISFLVHILISKYVDHLPLYRISGQLARQGLKIPDSTLVQWVKTAADHLLPLYEIYKIVLLRAIYLQMDETTLKVLEDGKGKCHLGYLWTAFDPVNKLPCFFYQKGRDHKGPKEFLERFAGILQCDGYSVYETLDKKMKSIELTHCMAHIRRKFFDAQKNDTKRAQTALTFIKALYLTEEKARLQQMNALQRFDLRQKEAKPVFDLLTTWLQEQYNKVTPQSAIGKAIAYALRLWDNMGRYLTDGSIEIDNNLVENVIRPAALGRKNYLFAGSHEAAQRTAMLYTFFSACKQHGISPEIWLTDVLNRMYLHPVNRLEELLPQNWMPKNEG